MQNETDVPMQKKCRFCDQELLENASFCTQCGSRVKQPDEVSEVSKVGQKNRVTRVRGSVSRSVSRDRRKPKIEHVELPSDIVYASLCKRIVAFVIDIVILCALTVGVSFCIGKSNMALFLGMLGFFAFFPTIPLLWQLIFAGIPGDSMAIAVGCAIIGIMLLISLGYSIILGFMECFFKGSFGKLVVGIRVVNAKYQSIGLFRACVRNLVKILLSGILLIGYTFAFIGKIRRTLHDSIASTYVVESKRRDK